MGHMYMYYIYTLLCICQYFYVRKQVQLGEIHLIVGYTKPKFFDLMASRSLLRKMDLLEYRGI